MKYVINVYDVCICICIHICQKHSWKQQHYMGSHLPHQYVSIHYRNPHTISNIFLDIKGNTVYPLDWHVYRFVVVVYCFWYAMIIFRLHCFTSRRAICSNRMLVSVFSCMAEVRGNLFNPLSERKFPGKSTTRRWVNVKRALHNRRHSVSLVRNKSFILVSRPVDIMVGLTGPYKPHNLHYCEVISHHGWHSNEKFVFFSLWSLAILHLSEC